MTHASRARGSGGGALTETLDRAAARSRPEPAETGARKQLKTRKTSGWRRTRHAGSKQEQGTIRRECEQKLMPALSEFSLYKKQNVNVFD